MLNPGSRGEHEVQERFGSSKRALAFYNNQILDHLNPLMREFITKQEMVFIATSDAQGECDCSFRAGGVGFVRILTEKLLVYPEYRGQGVYASLGNISENPNIGMMFIDFFEDTIGLHLNGKVERYQQSLKREVNQIPYEAPSQLDKAIADFVDYYNYRRYHKAIGDVTPADVLYGRREQILQRRKEVRIQTINRRRNYNRDLRELVNTA